MAWLNPTNDTCRTQRDDVELLLNLLTHIVHTAPASLSKSFRQYYTVLAELCGASNHDTVSPETTSRAVLVPLQTKSADDYLLAAYEALALSFLTRHDIPLVEENTRVLSQNLDSDHLASAITTAYTEGRIDGVSRDGQVWLLAHFIGLHQKTGSKSQGLKHLDALHIQLSSLFAEISLRLSVKPADPTSSTVDSNGTEENLLQPLPAYVTRQLTSLVDKDGISALLAELTRWVDFFPHPTKFANLM